jgi:hypothetical protein
MNKQTKEYKMSEENILAIIEALKSIAFALRIGWE